jgi:Protein of unknown function (DUF2510)
MPNCSAAASLGAMQGTWQPDPTGRHETRYWDGAKWTAWVSDAGSTSEDPVAWPQPPESAGLGLRSGYLRYFRQGGGPWPVVDQAGDQVGFLTRSSFSLTGRSISVWDMANAPWVSVKQSIHGTAIAVADQEVGRIQWHGVGSLGTVDITVHLGGRMRARMRATREDFADGQAVMTDPAGAPLLSLSITRQAAVRVLSLQRLVGMPDDYEYAVHAVVPAIILELDNRGAFQASNDDDNTLSRRSPWPQ